MLALGVPGAVSNVDIEKNLWPGRDKPEQNLRKERANIIKILLQALGSDKKTLGINSVPGKSLQLNMDLIGCDLIDFNHFYRLYKYKSDLHAAKQGVAIATRPFMEGYTEDVFLVEREKIEKRLSEMLTSLAMDALSFNRQQEAQEFYDRLHELNALDDVVVRAKMNVLVKMNRSVGAMDVYLTFEKDVEKKLGI